LRAPVGNNLDNNPEDVENLKRNFAAEGRYKKPVENGYHDQELDNSIFSFQREHNLKVDGRMNPGGETEAALVSKLLKLPPFPSAPKENEEPLLHKINEMKPFAAPSFGSISGLGGSIALGGGGMFWKNSTPDDRDKLVDALDHVLNNTSGNKDSMQHCDDAFDQNLERCKEVERIYGSVTARICRETAKTQYAQCLASKPRKDWRRLHERD
jgi:peptidoglycan hydrolase-like protein with peptidoglycan-binding domain